MRTMLVRAATAGAAAAAAVAARRAAEAGWRSLRGEEPPGSNPFDREQDLRDVLLWTATLAGSIWVAKRLATGITERTLAPKPVDAT